MTTVRFRWLTARPNRIPGRDDPRRGVFLPCFERFPVFGEFASEEKRMRRIAIFGKQPIVWQAENVQLR